MLQLQLCSEQQIKIKHPNPYTFTPQRASSSSLAAEGEAAEEVALTTSKDSGNYGCDNCLIKYHDILEGATELHVLMV